MSSGSKFKALRAEYVTWLLALTTVFFWASAFPAVKYLLGYFSPEALMLFRFSVASAVLFIYSLATKLPAPKKKDLPSFMLAGFIGIACYMWFFNTGTSMVTSGLSSFIIASCPVFTLIASILFLKEQAGLATWFGILLSLAGLILISYTQVDGAKLNLGVLVVLCATLCTSAYNIFQRNIMKKYSPMQATCYAIFFATAFMLVFMPKLAVELPKAPLFASLLVIYLGVFPAALAYCLWSYALSLAKKTVHVTSFLYLSPFLATAMSFFFLGERMEPLALAGGIIIVAGMVITNIKGTAR